jgi:hypothetical protein
VSRKSGKFRKSVLGMPRVDFDGDSRLSSSRFKKKVRRHLAGKASQRGKGSELNRKRHVKNRRELFTLVDPSNSQLVL